MMNKPQYGNMYQNRSQGYQAPGQMGQPGNYRQFDERGNRWGMGNPSGNPSTGFEAGNQGPAANWMNNYQGGTNPNYYGAQSNMMGMQQQGNMGYNNRGMGTQGIDQRNQVNPGGFESQRYSMNQNQGASGQKYSQPGYIGAAGGMESLVGFSSPSGNQGAPAQFQSGSGSSYPGMGMSTTPSVYGHPGNNMMAESTYQPFQTSTNMNQTTNIPSGVPGGQSNIHSGIYHSGANQPMQNIGRNMGPASVPTNNEDDIMNMMLGDPEQVKKSWEFAESAEKSIVVREIWIGNLPPTTTETRIREAFERSSSFGKDGITVELFKRDPKIFAFVKFKKAIDTVRAFDNMQEASRMLGGAMRMTLSEHTKRVNLIGDDPTIENVRSIHLIWT